MRGQIKGAMLNHFPFTMNQVIWTITFAAELTLLVVLLGRDRARRYPWFTTYIAVIGIKLLVEVLLTGRMANITLQTILISLADVLAVMSLLVVVELAWQAFAAQDAESCWAGPLRCWWWLRWYW